MTNWNFNPKLAAFAASLLSPVHGYNAIRNLPVAAKHQHISDIQHTIYKSPYQRELEAFG